MTTLSFGGPSGSPASNYPRRDIKLKGTEIYRPLLIMQNKSSDFYFHLHDWQLSMVFKDSDKSLFENKLKLIGRDE